jgi:hypothetical protein
MALVERDDASTVALTVIGQECHIVSRSPTGPRAGESPAGLEIDGYDNLVLLCPNCHVLVDARPDQFPRSELQRIKAEHEQTFARRSAPSKPLRMTYEDRFADLKFRHVATGDMLAGLLGSTLSFNHGHPPDLSSRQREILGDFFGELAEWGDALDIGGPKGQFEAAERFHEFIEDLREHDLFVYAAARRMKVTGGLAAEPSEWRHAVVYAVHEVDVLKDRDAPVSA